MIRMHYYSFIRQISFAETVAPQFKRKLMLLAPLKYDFGMLRLSPSQGLNVWRMFCHVLSVNVALASVMLNYSGKGTLACYVC